MIEASLCLKQLRATGIDGWALGIITPLPGDYWEDQAHRVYLLKTLLAVSVLERFYSLVILCQLKRGGMRRAYVM
jgi:hypothetical protein